MKLALSDEIDLKSDEGHLNSEHCGSFKLLKLDYLIFCTVKWYKLTPRVGSIMMNFNHTW